MFMNLKLFNTKARKLPESSSLSRGDANFLEHFFDANFYLNVNDDVKEVGIDPFAHFCVNGFGENRNPSRLVNFGYLQFLTEQTSLFSIQKPQTLQGLVALLKNWSVDSLFGPSELFSPYWVAMQLGFDESNTMSNIIAATVPVGSFSLHPGLSPMKITKPVKLSQLFAALQPEDFVEQSLVNLSEYATNHHDLKLLKNTPEAAFSHLWASGPHQNRLKYLGNRRSANASLDLSFLTQCSTIYRNHLVSPSLLAPKKPSHLQAQNLKFLDGADPLVAALSHIQNQSHPPSTSALPLAGFLAMQSLFSSSQTIVMPSSFQSLASVPSRVVGNKTLTDRDLMSGSHPVTTKRVVYGVNIGAYDDFPIPPEMDDCSYFLITDAAEVPSDCPWTIVSPTLQEIDIKRQCLWYKTHPHKLFPDAEFVTWIDSNIECRTHSGQVLMSHETLSEIATFVHPDRNCVYEEAIAIINIKLDKQEVIDRVVKNLKQQGLPKAFGLFETNVLFSRTQDPAVRDFFETWWRSIYLGSRRDQMSFTYASWKENVVISALDARFCAKNSRFFSKNSHKSREGRFV